MQQLYSTGEVARLLGIQQHRIVYAISTDRLPEVKCHFLNKRCFDAGEVRRIAKHFGVSLTKEGQNVSF